MHRSGGRTVGGLACALALVVLAPWLNASEKAQLRGGNVGYGLLDLSTLSAFHSLRLAPSIRIPSSLERGESELRASVQWVSYWGTERTVRGPVDPLDDNFFFDYEMSQITASLAHAVTERVTLEGSFRDRSRFGGNFDKISEDFHDLFAVEQNGRDRVPRGAFNFRVTPDDGRAHVVLEGSDRGSFSNTAQLTVQHNFHDGGRRAPAIAYSLTAGLEVGNRDDFESGDRWDLGGSLSAARRIGRFHVYGVLGYVRFGRDDFRGFDVGNRMRSVAVAGEWRFTTHQSFVAQYLLTEGEVDRLREFEDPSNEIGVGYKWELREGGVLEIGFVENFISFDNSPDFTSHVGYAQRF